MDLSKLPKFSESEKPAAEHQPPLRPVEPIQSAGAEAWLSIAIGVIVLLVYPRFLQWASSRVFGTHFNEFMLDGNVVPYTRVPEFWSDLGPTTFGIMLILDGISLALAKRPLLWVAFCFTVIVTLFNLIYFVASYSHGLAIVSAVAVVLGVYIAMQQWKMLRVGASGA